MAKKSDKAKPGQTLVCSNTKTLARFAVDERLEAGMVLMGSEVKSLRDRKADLEGAYARIDGGELYVHKMYIGPYAQATAFAHEPKRSRKLLAHRSEIERLGGKTIERGLTLVPTRLYFKDGRAKVELALAKGKDRFDKRETLKKKDQQRDMQRALREVNR